jgi:hypothetical protein
MRRTYLGERSTQRRGTVASRRRARRLDRIEARREVLQNRRAQRLGKAEEPDGGSGALPPAAPESD